MFLLTLPVAFPLWLLLVLLLWMMLALRALWRPICSFWSAPQRHRYDYDPYSRYYGLVQPTPLVSNPEEHVALLAAE
ncbi:MAG TPA: hypothetical protein VFW19_13435 [Allosphingosinicella sp.]|nr:hypothetical protein [Allosphingosinicella sp.]